MQRGGVGSYPAAEEASCSNIHRALLTIQPLHVDVEEDGVVVGVAIVLVYTIEPLGKLNEANVVPLHRIEEETHGLHSSKREWKLSDMCFALAFLPTTFGAKFCTHYVHHRDTVISYPP